MGLSALMRPIHAFETSKRGPFPEGGVLSIAVSFRPGTMEVSFADFPCAVLECASLRASVAVVGVKFSFLIEGHEPSRRKVCF